MLDLLPDWDVVKLFVACDSHQVKFFSQNYYSFYKEQKRVSLI